MLKHEEAIAEYLRKHPQGVPIKHIEVDLGISNGVVHYALSRMKYVWIDHWETGVGRPRAIYRIVPPDAERPTPKYKYYPRKKKERIA